MILRLIGASIRQKRIALISYSLAGIAFIAMYLAAYPSLAAQAESAGELMKALPPAILKAFGADTIGLTSFEGLAGLKQYGFVWPLMAVLFATSLAGAMLAGEVEKRTMGLWLAAPISRTKIFWSKYLAGFILISLFTLLTITVVIPLAAVANIKIGADHFLMLSLIGELFAVAVFSFAMMLSAMSSERSRVYSLVGGILLTMYVGNLLAELVEGVSWIRYGSIFHYYAAEKTLTGADIGYLPFIVLGAAIVICSAAGAIVFRRRDISI